MGTHKYSTAQVEQSIDTILMTFIRGIVLVFFFLVASLAFVFGVVLTVLCVSAVVLRFTLRFACSQRMTQRAFALAGLA